jgi:hypothetical protein
MIRAAQKNGQQWLPILYYGLPLPGRPARVLAWATGRSGRTLERDFAASFPAPAPAARTPSSVCNNAAQKQLAGRIEREAA